MIDPVQERLLVRTFGEYQNLGTTTEERFGTSKLRGIVEAIAPDIKEKCKELNISVGDMVYFGKYEDGASYGPDQDLILIKLEDIGGRSAADEG